MSVHGIPARPLGASGAPPNAPHTQVRPTVVFAVLFLAGIALDQAAPQVLDVPHRWRWAGALLLVAGASLTTWCLVVFGRLGTGIMPDRPARQVVTTGPYGWSRNPMFVGFALMYLGGALFLNAAWTLVLLPVGLAVTTLTVIRHEEHYMRRAFGSEYERYARRVNRWLGRAPQGAGGLVAASGTDTPMPVSFGPRHTVAPCAASTVDATRKRTSRPSVPASRRAAQSIPDGLPK